MKTYRVEVMRQTVDVQRVCIDVECGDADEARRLVEYRIDKDDLEWGDAKSEPVSSDHPWIEDVWGVK